MKINKTIIIVRSSKTWLSSLSRESSEAIKLTLSKQYITVSILEVDNLDDLNELVQLAPDIVFLGVKFVPADNTVYSQHSPKIWLSAYLDLHGIAYTGSNKMAHLLELDKPAAKRRVIRDGLNSSAYMVVKQTETLLESSVTLNYPLFVKPSNRGGGLGINNQSVVRNYDELLRKVNSIKNVHESDSLIEEYLTGREFSVAILKNQLTNKLQALPIEIITEPNEKGIAILSGAVKSANQERVVAVSDEEVRESLIKLAISVFNSLGSRDYGRIDIRFDKNGVPQFLEANLIPSLIDNYGNFSKACRINLSMDYENMIMNIVELACRRDGKSTNYIIDSEEEQPNIKLVENVLV